jgi:hypothetical protein
MAAPAVLALSSIRNLTPTASRNAGDKNSDRGKLEGSQCGTVNVAKRNWEAREAIVRQWCRGPESNWLRPPFQGGALPVSYPGTQSIKCRGRRNECQIIASVVAAIRFYYCPVFSISGGRSPQLLRRFVELFHPCPPFKQFPRFCAIRRTDDAVFLHQIDQSCGAAIAHA